MKIYIIFLLGLILCVRCETVLDLEEPTFTNKLVLQAEIHMDSMQIDLYLAENFSVFENNRFDYDDFQVDDAQGTITINNTVLNLQPHDHFFNNYKVQIPFALKAGDDLFLEINHPNFESITAQSTIPSGVFPKIATYEPDAGINIDGDDIGRITVTLDDPIENNYYQVGIVPLIDDGSSYFIDISSLDPSVIASQDFAKLIIEDSAFNGETKIFELDISSFFGTREEFTENYLLLWENITEDHYRFLKTFKQSEDNEDNPFITPFNIHSNVENGLGVFTGVNKQYVLIQ